jgi:hypothetical protein
MPAGPGKALKQVEKSRIRNSECEIAARIPHSKFPIPDFTLG